MHLSSDLLSYPFGNLFSRHLFAPSTVAPFWLSAVLFRLRSLFLPPSLQPGARRLLNPTQGGSAFEGENPCTPRDPAFLRAGEGAPPLRQPCQPPGPAPGPMGALRWSAGRGVGRSALYKPVEVNPGAVRAVNGSVALFPAPRQRTRLAPFYADGAGGLYWRLRADELAKLEACTCAERSSVAEPQESSRAVPLGLTRVRISLLHRPAPCFASMALRCDGHRSLLPRASVTSRPYRQPLLATSLSRHLFAT